MRAVHGLCLSFVPGLALAQPSLSSLWPNVDGTRWEYRVTVLDPTTNWTGAGTMRFDGSVETPGGTAQVLFASHPTPRGAARAGGGGILGAIWRARPDLRPALESKYGAQLTGEDSWWPLLIGPGYFMKAASALQMWQPDWNHPTWTFATSDLGVGSTFMQQLVPELADDVYLHGTVESIDATIATDAGTFEPAVRMGYVVDYGWSDGVDENQLPIGRFRGEMHGRIHFAPDFGPVEEHEEFLPFVEIDCTPNTCPPAWTDLLGEVMATVDLSLTDTTVAVAERTFGQVKALYR